MPKFPAAIIKFDRAPAGLYLPAESAAKLAALLGSIKPTVSESLSDVLDEIIAAAQAPALADFTGRPTLPQRVIDNVSEPDARKLVSYDEGAQGEYVPEPPAEPAPAPPRPSPSAVIPRGAQGSLGSSSNKPPRKR